MIELNLVSMNCRGLSDATKRRDVMHFLRNNEYDVLFLQDTHLTQTSLQYFNSLWKGKSYHACHTNRSRGVSILFKYSLQHDVIQVKHADCGNFIIVTCKIGTQTYLLANVYGPNEDDPVFYQTLTHHIESFSTDHIIIGGDFNFVINPKLDSFNYAREYNTNAKRVFINFIDENMLSDVWRSKNPQRLEYTWLQNNPLKGGRLDMIFVNSQMMSFVRDVTIKPGYRTDHCLVAMKMQIAEVERGPGIWKFNESILQDDEYVDIVKNTIGNVVFQYAIPVYDEEYVTNENNFKHIQLTINDNLFYETLLMTIRGETVKYCKRKARKRRLKEVELTNKVQTAHDIFNNDKSNVNAQHLCKAKEELEVHRKPYIDGLIIRSKTQWHEEGERSSKYFLSLEKRNADRKSVQFIESDGQTITKSEAILSLFTNSLQDKYSAHNPTGDLNLELIKSNVTEKLTETEKGTLETEITLKELSTALRDMKKGKTPGSNGFSVDFFRCFWNMLGIFLFRAFQFCFSRGESLATHRESIITLIPKSGRSPHSLKGWRPISLLNVDYKIISTAIANRFKKVIDHIISPSQSAYIKGRYIGENTRLVYDVIQHLNKTKQSGVIMAADFEAAFETVSWPYLRSVIRELNFGNYFMKLIDTMYLNKQNFSRIIMNGFLGDKIFLQRGIRQGDPVSGYLFNIAVLILSKQITTSKNLTGILLSSNAEVRISQYADDTILFLDSTKRSLVGATEELSMFSTQSGLNINWEKTSCMFVGTSNAPDFVDDAPANKIKWVNEMKILGIYFQRKIDNITEINFERKIELLEKDIAQWKRRHITPLGKITVIKSLLLAKIVHLFIALPNPSQAFIKKIERMLYGFLWNNKPDRIKRTKAVQKHKSDGLQMIDLTSFIHSLKITWLQRLVKSAADWIKAVDVQQLDPLKLLTQGASQLKAIKADISNTFWKDVVDSLIQFNQRLNLEPEEIKREYLWFSDFTKFKTSIIYQWDRKGLRFIGDLFNASGNILTRDEIKTQYRISMTFLCYESLIRSLPLNLRNTTCVPYERPSIPFKLQLFLSKRKIAKYCYSLFITALRKKDDKTDKNLRQKWERDINFYREGTMLRIKKSTRSVYLLYLHCRIVNRIITTNKFLHTIRISDSAVCTFCARHTETIIHLFWQCPVTQTFLQNVDRELRDKCQIRFRHTAQSWFFPEDVDNLQILFITIAKAVIYKSRNAGTNPEMAHFLNLLKSEAQKEQFASKMKNNIKSFENKWKTVRYIL